MAPLASAEHRAWSRLPRPQQQSPTRRFRTGLLDYINFCALLQHQQLTAVEVSVELSHVEVVEDGGCWNGKNAMRRLVIAESDDCPFSSHARPASPILEICRGAKLFSVSRPHLPL